MKTILFIAGLLAVVTGLLQIFNRDMAWRSAQGINRLNGTKSERTRTWEVASILQGVLGVAVGAALMWAASQ